MKAFIAAFKEVTTIEAEPLMLHSLPIFGYDSKRQTARQRAENVLRFKEQFGPAPEVVASVLNALKNEYPEDFKIKEALMTFNWLKCYATERVVAGPWRVGCLKYLRDTLKSYTRKISSLRKFKIIFGGFEEGDIYPYSVDGVHFATSEFLCPFASYFYILLIYLDAILDEFRLSPSADWFDFKSHGAGLKYEVATAIRRDAIVWLRGPFPASTADITIFRGGKAEEDEATWDPDSLYFATKALGPDVKGVGDSAFAGEPGALLTSKEGQSKDLCEFQSRSRLREETLYSRFKSWNILENRFRHGHGTEERQNLHKHVVTAIAVITQFDLEHESPLFEVR